MNNPIIALTGLSLLLLTASCNKDDDDALQGGKGGAATLNVNTFHHSRRIDSAMIYIKYQAKDLPADGRYDDSARIVKGIMDTVAVFTGLKAGSYYLYGKGWDRFGPYAVQGGIPYQINSEINLTVNVPVSEEGH
jgi:hypothetical protein